MTKQKPEGKQPKGKNGYWRTTKAQLKKGINKVGLLLTINQEQTVNLKKKKEKERVKDVTMLGRRWGHITWKAECASLYVIRNIYLRALDSRQNRRGSLQSN